MRPLNPLLHSELRLVVPGKVIKYKTCKQNGKRKFE